MDHKDGDVLVKYEHYLQEAMAVPSSPNEPLVILDAAWKRAFGRLHRSFRFFRQNAVSSNVLDVPIVPTEVHDLLMQ